METLNLKPTHKPVREYYLALKQYEKIGVSHEGAVKVAFQNLLEHCCRQLNWKLVNEYKVDRPNRRSAFVDGACIDEFTIVHGHWEAKDEHDDLKKEVKKKFALGYPKNNIIFQAPTRAILYQNGKQILDNDITSPDNLVEILERFFEYTHPVLEEWEQAAVKFKDKVPDLASALLKIINKERQVNRRFITAFNDFYAICKESINPNLSEEAVKEMLIQHLLTERLFRNVFNNSDFNRRNVIAIEIEKVIDSLTSRAFSREEFLSALDPFFKAIELAAATITDYSDKQRFLNTVYEKFFQGFAVKVADTHGIVYTPQQVVNFMVNSVNDMLQQEFGKALGTNNVHILDPFVGTGNFVIHIMQKIKKTELSRKYKDEIHCNEVMLLPYYISSMNIEHEFLDIAGSYDPFPGICLVDTFELAESKQGTLSFMTAENTARVERQKQSPIFVIIGNPPYNAKQVNANDNNKNRKYETMDRRVRETYAKDSNATLVNKLNDPYVKAIRWASDRVIKNGEGVVAFVTNSSFIHKRPFDGMRYHLKKDFNRIYILDLKGDVRSDSMREGIPIGEEHTIFGLAAMVGIAITFLIRGNHYEDHKIFYSEVDWRSTRLDKFKLLQNAHTAYNLEWKEIEPDSKNSWITEGLQDDFQSFIPLGGKGSKAAKTLNVQTIFKTYSLGISTNRDPIVYDFNKQNLLSRVEKFCDNYNSEVERYKRKGKPKDVENFVNYDTVTWSETLLNKLKSGIYAEYDPIKLRLVLYRTFTKRWLYYDPVLIDRPGLFSEIFPTSESENIAIGVCAHSQVPFSAQMVSTIPSLDLNGRPTQFFPFYIYGVDSTIRRENITDWTLEQFTKHYGDMSITKRDVFYYVYAVLHHPFYRHQYALDLKRELPRIPLASDFYRLATAGKQLADLHAFYERQPEYPIEHIESAEEALDWSVRKMKLAADKLSIIYNDFLTLRGIPKDTFEYRIGNRSALHCVMDQYQVVTDDEGEIVEDPNNIDDEEYIVRLVERVVTVSIETVGIVNSLPKLELPSNR